MRCWFYSSKTSAPIVLAPNSERFTAVVIDAGFTWADWTDDSLKIKYIICIDMNKKILYMNKKKMDMLQEYDSDKKFILARRSTIPCFFGRWLVIEWLPRTFRRWLRTWWKAGGVETRRTALFYELAGRRARSGTRSGPSCFCGILWRHHKMCCASLLFLRRLGGGRLESDSRSIGWRGRAHGLGC